MLLRAAELGADTFEAFTNSPPYFWTVSGSSRCAVCTLQQQLRKLQWPCLHACMYPDTAKQMCAAWLLPFGQWCPVHVCI
jgi:hypothetical protein